MLAVAVGTAIAILLHRAEPMMRASLIDTLQKRFHAKVELDDLHVSILDGFWVEGRGLREAAATHRGLRRPIGLSV